MTRIIQSHWLKSLLRTVQPDAKGTGRISGRKIYIIPTGYGLVYGILLVTLLIASINYANNPAFLLTFLLSGVFIQAIFQTWKNLLHLQIRFEGCDGVFAADTAYPEFSLIDPGSSSHYAIQLAFDGEAAVVTDCIDGKPVTIRIPCKTRRRGLQTLPRLTVETRFPLGLLRAWCYLQSPAEIIVWPRPLSGKLESTAPDYQNAAEGNRGVGTDDFVGNRNYRLGDQPAHINWKALAAEKGLLVKEYGGDRVNLLWLDFEDIPVNDTEIRLGILAGAIEKLSHEDLHYGLRLPELEIQPSRGAAQRQKCLNALALFGGRP